MLKVEFENINDVEDKLFKYAVIASRYQNRWIYCKHKNRETWEVPGGHREPEEPIIDTARHELYEETGALSFELLPVCAYSVTGDEKSYGLLCYADIKTLGRLPDFEIELIQLFDDEPYPLTYPQIQPFLFEKIRERISCN
jgi:8-oxo-dGTP diphosphatase